VSEEREETTLDEPVSATLKREFQVSLPLPLMRKSHLRCKPVEIESRVLVSGTQGDADVHHVSPHPRPLSVFASDKRGGVCY
jgi:hypothetical protein